MTLALCIGICIYVYRCSKSREAGYESKYGPFLCVFIASFFILADPSRHILQDLNIWPAPSSSEYREDCDEESIRCLSVVGLIFTIICTWLGFFLLVCGNLWNAHILQHCQSIAYKWKQLRRMAREEQQHQDVEDDMGV